MFEMDWKLINKCKSCALLTHEQMNEGEIPTTPTSSAIIAGVQVQEMLKLLHSDRGLPTLAGTTADVGGGDRKQLSLVRANAARNMLVDAGVPCYQIETIGFGCSENCLRVEDHNSDGSLNESAASYNRAIYIILSDSATAHAPTA